MTSRKSALSLVIMLAVIAVIGNTAEAWPWSKKKTAAPAPAKAAKADTAPVTSAVYVKRVNAFIKDARWKPGTTYSSSQRPKLSKYSCVGCCAYAADFVQYVFGKSSPRGGTEFRSLGQVKTGDVIVFSGPPHWVVVLARRGNTLETIEGNWMGKAVREKAAYTINGNNLLRNGKKFRTFSLGYHFL